MAMAIPKRIGEIAIVPTVATDRSNALLKNWLYHREIIFNGNDDKIFRIQSVHFHIGYRQLLRFRYEGNILNQRKNFINKRVKPPFVHSRGQDQDVLYSCPKNNSCSLVRRAEPGVFPFEGGPRSFIIDNSYDFDSKKEFVAE